MSSSIEQTGNETPAVHSTKPKPAAKSMVTLDIKPWGMRIPQSNVLASRYSTDQCT